jgi:hypothetical protein
MKKKVKALQAIDKVASEHSNRSGAMACQPSKIGPGSLDTDHEKRCPDYSVVLVSGYKNAQS